MGLSDSTEEYCYHTCSTPKRDRDPQNKDGINKHWFLYALMLPAGHNYSKLLILFFVFDILVITACHTPRMCGSVCVCVCALPVKPQASASKNVLHDMRKNRAVSNSWKSRSLVNLVTWTPQSKNLTTYSDIAKSIHADLFTNNSILRH